MSAFDNESFRPILMTELGPEVFSELFANLAAMAFLSVIKSVQIGNKALVLNALFQFKFVRIYSHLPVYTVVTALSDFYCWEDILLSRTLDWRIMIKLKICTTRQLAQQHQHLN